MAEQEKTLIDIAALAEAIVQDLTAFAKAAGAIEVTEDLKKIDFAALLPTASAKLIKEAGSRITAEITKVRQDQETEIENKERLLEEAIAARRERARLALKDFAVAEGDDAAKIVKAKMEREVKHLTRREAEIKLAKAAKREKTKAETIISGREKGVS